MAKQETMTSGEFQALIQQHNDPSGNCKVRNATRNERDGIVYDSLVERYMFDLLEIHGIRFEFQKRYILQQGFRYNGEIIRAITYTVDFWLPDHDIVIDTKGIRTQQGNMRIKMLKQLFSTSGLNTGIELPRTKQECVLLIEKLITPDDNV